MIEIKGKYNEAIIYADELDERAIQQIQELCECEEFADSHIRIMPDAHSGIGCTIGTTMTINDKVVPGIVGVDIGCGMEVAEIEETGIDFHKLDKVIKSKIPSGMKIRSTSHPLTHEARLDELRSKDKINLDRASKSIGTLGGGNHFIEVAKSESGTLYIVVHSGSRNLGTQVAKYYQDLAAKNHKDKIKSKELQKDLAYVEGELLEDYLHDMKIVQNFALLNRKAIMDIVLKEMNLTANSDFTTIHNYIDTDTMILRKGAVSAEDGEKLIIPINMRDGSLICIGKGNPDWNKSAPHGAGRLMSRKTAIKDLTLEEYEKSMEGIYSSSVNKSTLDEAPMAYKPMEDIIKHIEPTVDIIERIEPLYNFKAPE